MKIDNLSRYQRLEQREKAEEEDRGYNGNYMGQITKRRGKSKEIKRMAGTGISSHTTLERAQRD